MATYAPATGPPKLAARKYWWNKDEVVKAKKFAKNDGKVAYMSLPKEAVEKEEKNDIVYHTQAVATGKIENMNIDEIEECLGPILKKARMIQRGKSFGTVVVTFATEEEAYLLASEILKSEKLIMAPSSGGQKSTRIRIGKIPIKISVEWVVACLFGDMNLEITEVGTTPALNWWGYGIEIWVNATEEQIEKIPYRIFVQGERSLNVIVYGRSPVCYFCLQRGHFKAYCPEKKKEEMVEVEAEVEEEKKEEEEELVEEEKVIEEENIYEKITTEETTGSEEFVPVKRRKKVKSKKKKDLKQEPVPKKNMKPNEGKKVVAVEREEESDDCVEPDDVLLVVRLTMQIATSVEKELTRKKKLISFGWVSDEVGEVYGVKRKDFEESGMERLYTESQVWAEIVAGQEVRPEMRIKEITKLKGYFKYQELDDLTEVKYM